MSANYDYLKPYMWQAYRGNPVDVSKNNIFYNVDRQHLIELEKKIIFPTELKDFYLQIGYGQLTTPYQPKENYSFFGSNEILPPHIAVDYMQGITEHPDEEEYYMSRDTYEDLEPGDLPFFEIANGSSFMIVKLNSDNPNAVWYMGQEKIEDSFERFIWRLYYEDPNYYAQNW